jgi:hypothetical protein
MDHGCRAWDHQDRGAGQSVKGVVGMRNRRRSQTQVDHRHLHRQDLNDPVPSYLGELELGSSIHIAVDLKTADEIVHSDGTVEAQTPYATAS